MTDTQPIVQLWELCGTGLIIPWPSGVRYSNQTGGTACNHPEQEGVFVPIGNDVPESVESAEVLLDRYFTGPVHGGAGVGRGPSPGLSADDADFIDGILDRFHQFNGIRVDRSRLRDSDEAWVFVQIEAPSAPAELSILAGFEPYPRSAILTWPNSD